MAKVILYYSPFNGRSRDTESLMIAFREQGHRVISLSQQPGKDLHEVLRAHGIETYTHVLPGNPNLWYFFRQFIFFIRFCRRHRVDVVFSHLEPANYVASVAQFFIPARVILCRHHMDEASLYGYDKALSYRITYAFAREIIVVSEKARRYMIDNEKIPASKIILINLAYDFSLYEKPDLVKAGKIREKYPADVVMLMVGRLTKYKRPEIAVRMVRRLAEAGIRAQLIILGKGVLLSTLEAQVHALNLGEQVHLLGHVGNVLDYMKACDYLIHPSLSESSCVVTKEAGLADKAVIACAGVGDFDSYIQNDKNGFLVSTTDFEEEAGEIIRTTYQNKQKLDALGKKLHEDVVRLFDVSTLIGQYTQLLNKK